MAAVSISSSSLSLTTASIARGKLLLHELSIPPSYSSIETCVEIINKDPKTLRVLDDYGNNAYHLLVGSNFDKTYVNRLLPLLIAKSPSGIRVKNKDNNLPIHLCLSQPTIVEEAALLLLEKYPESASMTNNNHISLLFLAVMRDNASFTLCKALCVAHKDSVRMTNRTGSIPLHFLCRRKHINIQILQMLLKRNSDGASVANTYGLLPLHCMSECCDDIEAVKMLYNAYPGAIKMTDNQGKTCLHLAVLSTARSNDKAKKDREDAEATDNIDNDGGGDRSGMEEGSNRDRYNGPNKDDSETDSDDDGNDNENSTMDYTQHNNNKDVLRYIIEMYPKALVTKSNFGFTPVDTIIEKVKAIDTKKKRVSVFGLFDDPVIARLLLLQHKKYSLTKNMLPPLRASHHSILKQLNWLARRDAILVSMAGVPKNTYSSKPSATNSKSKNNHYHSSSNKASNSSSRLSTDEYIDLFNKIPVHNILSRLRFKGCNDMMRLCISYL